MRLGKLTLSCVAILTLSSLGAGQNPPEQHSSMDARLPTRVLRSSVIALKHGGLL
jgi:hypothetical protein